MLMMRSRDLWAKPFIGGRGGVGGTAVRAFAQGEFASQGSLVSLTGPHQAAAMALPWGGVWGIWGAGEWVEWVGWGWGGGGGGAVRAVRAVGAAGALACAGAKHYMSIGAPKTLHVKVKQAGWEQAGGGE